MAISPRSPGSAFTAPTKASPRFSKFGNYSKEAQAGDSSTTLPGRRVAESPAAVPACALVPDWDTVTDPPSVLANSLAARSEEPQSDLQSFMRHTYAVFSL